MAFTEEQIKAFPSWLQKLARSTPEQRQAFGYTDEDFEQATKAYHLDADYTKKSQKAAELEKIQEQYPNLSLGEAAKVYDWWQANGEQVNKFWPHRDKIQGILDGRPEPAALKPAPGTRRKWRDADAAALYETSQLREVFEDLYEDARTSAIKSVREDWYQKEEVPRLDGVAGGYFARAIDLIDFARDPAYAGLDIYDVIKAAAAQGIKPGPDGRLNFRPVAKSMVEERERLRKDAEDVGYKRGVEETKKSLPSPEGPSGPIGTGHPSWRPAPTDQKPKTREEFRDRVLQEVEKKHGRLPL